MCDGYRYPDADDRITLAAFNQVRSSWISDGKSAEHALALLSERLGALLPSRDMVRGLDAGCGQGRLIPWVAQFAAEITAIDVDIGRLEAARKYMSIPQTALNIKRGEITNIEGGPFDLVICSHVIQHVPTIAVRRILERLAKLTSPGGVMVLAFSRSAAGRENYGLSYLDAGSACITAISKERFDAVAGRADHRGSVPFRRIDLSTLSEQAHDAGWKMLWKWNYHLAGAALNACPITFERVSNLSIEMEAECDGDIYMIWQKAL